MQAVKSKTLGLILAFLGWIGAIVSCALPKWKITTNIQSQTGTQHTIWEGIWKRCEGSPGEMQCEIYDSMTLSSDLQAARPLCIVVIVMGVLGIFFFIVGAFCYDQVMIVSGGTFICAAILLLIPVCWATYSTIKHIFPVINSEYIEIRKIGASLYLGMASTALLFGGGSILGCNCLPDSVLKVCLKGCNALIS
ncbi:claudin-4-like [Misgurnus anguillicaudatus]|uniref:claudin-4-like n=1 Tax=Misgurnus anguillicaudatus TaxID=75329 RepID=UPI003CCF6B2F